jgi:hypothetical protein
MDVPFSPPHPARRLLPVSARRVHTASVLYLDSTETGGHDTHQPKSSKKWNYTVINLVASNQTNVSECLNCLLNSCSDVCLISTSSWMILETKKQNGT